MERIAANLCELVGGTPLVRLSCFGEGLPGEITAKMDSLNPLLR